MRFHVYDHEPRLTDTDGQTFDANTHSGAAVAWAGENDHGEDIARGNLSPTLYVLQDGDAPADAVCLTLSGTLKVTYSARASR